MDESPCTETNEACQQSSVATISSYYLSFKPCFRTQFYGCDACLQVLVGLNETFQVADHDFSKASFTPSVVLDVSIPEKVTDSWYEGEVTVTLKDAVFQVVIFVHFFVLL